MPWRKVSIMEQRREFVSLFLLEDTNRRELCRRFGISPQAGYKWVDRFLEGDRELCDRSRQPHSNPLRYGSSVEEPVLAVRDAHPAWGARKIARCLERDGITPPAVSTVHAILKRHERVGIPVGSPGTPYKRFEREAPNLMWQMDFKGHVPLSRETSCHPLTVIDDHSRYAVCLRACSNEQIGTVKDALVGTFRRYGMPDAFLVDNGSPWGDAAHRGWTKFGVWLLKLGVRMHRGRPHHPQTRGKNERFNRTLKDEVFALRRFQSLREAQSAFDAWREIYNMHRPHEALGQNVPASRYRPSTRSMPAKIPSVEYDDGEITRRVSSTKAYIAFKGRHWKLPQAFRGEQVALRPRSADGVYAVCFGAHQIAELDLNSKTVNDVPEQVSTMSPG